MPNSLSGASRTTFEIREDAYGNPTLFYQGQPAECAPPLSGDEPVHRVQWRNGELETRRVIGTDLGPRFRMWASAEVSDLGRVALDYARNGIPVFPCKPDTKRPFEKGGFKTATVDLMTVAQWWKRWPNALIGMPTGKASGIAVLDLDVKNGKDGLKAVPDWQTRSTVIARTRSGGIHLYFANDDTVRSQSDQIAPGVDTRGNGGYVIVPPSTGYEFVKGDLIYRPSLPVWPDDMRPKKRESKAQERSKAKSKPSEHERAKIAAALDAIPSDDYQVWFEVAAALRSALGSGGYELFQKWSAQSDKFNERECSKQWESVASVEKFTVATIYHHADKSKPEWREEFEAKHRPHIDELEGLIRDGSSARFVNDPSSAVWFVINELLRCGHYEAAIESILFDNANGISAHVYGQPEPIGYVREQIANAIEKIELATDGNGKPTASQANVRVALLKLGVRVRYDRFAARMLISGLKDFGPAIDDAAMDRMWLLVDQRFRFRPSKDVFYTIVQDTGRLNQFHPVRDYLDGLKWDGVKRIDKWLTTYGGAESSEYVDAVGALILIAAVRRIRRPGCKFDELLVLEGQQGKNKSLALVTLVTNPEWFSDDLPLNADTKRVIESLHGRWIIEAAELTGMKRTDIEHLKAFLSRQVDRSRMAYGRMVLEVARQCVIVGTTNSSEYLRDTTGNRRFWPVQIREFDIEALKRDRDQLWAEAVIREASGASIRLDKRLWESAAAVQDERTTEDPYFERLRDALDGLEGKIAKEEIWNLFGVSPERRGQEQSRRISDAMRRLGWQLPSNRTVTINNRKVSGFTKGEQPWPEVKLNL